MPIIQGHGSYSSFVEIDQRNFTLAESDRESVGKSSIQKAIKTAPQNTDRAIFFI